MKPLQDEKAWSRDDLKSAMFELLQNREHLDSEVLQALKNPTFTKEY